MAACSWPTCIDGLVQERRNSSASDDVTASGYFFMNGPSWNFRNVIPVYITQVSMVFSDGIETMGLLPDMENCWCACAGNAGNVSPPPRVNDPDMLHGTYGHARATIHARIANPRLPLKAVVGKTLPAFPAHAQPAILRIWQEAHGFWNTFVCTMSMFHMSVGKCI